MKFKIKANVNGWTDRSPYKEFGFEVSDTTTRISGIHWISEERSRAGITTLVMRECVRVAEIGFWDGDFYIPAHRIHHVTFEEAE